MADDLAGPPIFERHSLGPHSLGRPFKRSLAIAALLSALLPSTAVHSRDAETRERASPQELSQELFVAVQTRRIFPDGKPFADAVPNEAPDRVLAEYRRQRPRSSDAL